MLSTHRTVICVALFLEGGQEIPDTILLHPTLKEMSTSTDDGRVRTDGDCFRGRDVRFPRSAIKRIRSFRLLRVFSFFSFFLQASFCSLRRARQREVAFPLLFAVHVSPHHQMRRSGRGGKKFSNFSRGSLLFVVVFFSFSFRFSFRLGRPRPPSVGTRTQQTIPTEKRGGGAYSAKSGSPVSFRCHDSSPKSHGELSARRNRELRPLGSLTTPHWSISRHGAPILAFCYWRNVPRFQVQQRRAKKRGTVSKNREPCVVPLMSAKLLASTSLFNNARSIIVNIMSASAVKTAERKEKKNTVSSGSYR